MNNIENLFVNPTFPSVHLNGSGAKYLKEGCEAVLESLRNTRETMAQNGPHARDYYVLGQDAFSNARDQHRLNLLMIDRLVTHYEQMWLAIDDQDLNRR
jgi:hypothetical protein